MEIEHIVDGEPHVCFLQAKKRGKGGGGKRGKGKRRIGGLSK